MALLCHVRGKAHEALLNTLRGHMEEEAQVIIAEGADARAQLDGHLDAARQAISGVESRLEMCRRDAELRLGALESSGEGGEFAESIQGILDALKAAFTGRRVALEAELQARQADFSRLESEMACPTARQLRRLSCASSSSGVSSPASLSGEGGSGWQDAVLWTKIQEAEVVKQFPVDTYVEEVARGIMAEVDAHLDQFKPFEQWVGEVATSMSLTLKECLCLQEVLVDARMAMHIAMRKHFESVV